jgi:hypothetical protein
MNLTVIPALCGTCEHLHPYAGCEHCGAANRECPGWTVHPTTADRATDQQIRELTELGGVPLVDVYMSGGVLDILCEVEKKHAREPVSETPSIFALQFHSSERSLTAEQNIIRAYELRLPSDTFFRDTFADDAMAPLTDLATRWFHDSPQTTLAWAIVCDGEVEPAGGGGRQPAHVAAAIDLDGRAYAVVRERLSDAVEREVTAMPGWARLLRGDAEFIDNNPIGQLKADRLSKPHMVVMHLMIITRVCMDAFDEITKGATG